MMGNIHAQFECANLALDLQDFIAARSIYEGILAEEPDNARALHALGVVLFRGWRDTRNAVKLIRQALELKADFADAYNNLGKILQESLRIRPAIFCYRQSVLLETNNQVVWTNLGSAYSLLNKADEALLAFQSAIQIAPDNFEALLGIARSLIEMKRYQDSMEYFSKARDLQPQNATVFYGIALAYKHMGHFSISRTNLLRSLELNPDYAEAYRGLADVLLALGDADSSAEAARKAIALKPDFKDAYTFLLYAMHYPSAATQKDLYAETVTYCERFLNDIPRYTNHDNERTRDRVLNIGYMSGEFNRHPVGFFIEQPLAYHNADAVNIYCYSNGPVTDWMTERLKKYAVVWRNISGICDEAVASQIRYDGIDILVDLSGHTGHGRMRVMARKPAPIQVSWIGYYNTTGLDSFDYIMMDAHTVSFDMVKWFTERVVYLPESRFCFMPPPDYFAVKTLPAIRNGFVTFGCFNNISKISPVTIEIWSAILSLLPDALLVLKWESFSDSSVVKRLQDMFECHGVGSSRVEYRRSSDYGTLLDEYGDIDIALDPFPFSGATTTCEALWMGVPVITMPGPLPAGRQSMALLNVIGLPEFIADSREAYVELALRHAGDLEVLSNLRQRLRGMMASSPLCDGQRFTKELESAYRLFWCRWCEGDGGGIADYDRSPLEILPAVPEIAYNKGVAYLLKERWLDSKRFLEQAIALKPDFPEAFNNLGIVWNHLGELEAAEVWFDKAIQLSPGFVEALNNQGKNLTALKKEKKALLAFSEVLRLDPGYYQAWNNLGELHFNAGRLAKARACFRKVLRYNPDFLEAHNNLAKLYLQYDMKKGFAAYKTIMKLNPALADAHSNMIFAMHYNACFSRADIFRETCFLGEKFYNDINLSHGGFGVTSDAKKRFLKVGFVSADFHQHPGGVFFQALARCHGRSQFFFICYDNAGIKDMITDDIKRHVEQWRCITGTTDTELCNLIKSDEIDILIDLSGFTAGQRLSAFARKPAPVQASWLGWFNTTGIKAIDYLIADHLMVPVEEERFFVEKIIYLPQGRFCYTPPFLCPDVDVLPAIDNKFITFGCFNNLAKITDQVVSVWAAILRQVPNSRLVLKSPYFKDYELRRRVQRRFKVHGISPERLELRQHSPHFFMMVEYGDIDIALDPFPYCGGLTSCEALWMGVPVVTLPGELPVSRQTESFLKAIGLSGCIARTEQDYVEKVCDWAADLERLTVVRTALREQMAGSSLCDGERFAVDFGEVLHTIWQHHSGRL